MQHCFASVSEHLAGTGRCLVCKKNHGIDSSNIDIRVWSPPCQPFSEMRWKSGTSSKTGAPSEHPQNSITMDDLLELTEASTPLITLIEQVGAFLKSDKGKESPGHIVVSALEKIYGKGAVGVVQLDSGVWLQGCRKRPLTCISQIVDVVYNACLAFQPHSAAAS
jgi:hypothetical protein